MKESQILNFLRPDVKLCKTIFAGFHPSSVRHKAWTGLLRVSRAVFRTDMPLHYRGYLAQT